MNTLVRIEHEGVTGLGEAAPSHYYGETTAMVEEAVVLREVLQDYVRHHRKRKA